MDNSFMKLRTAAFGGFNKQDVIAYIEKVKNEAYEERTRLLKQVKELTDKIGELEAKVSDFDAEKEKLVRHIGELTVSSEGKNETVEEINEATNHLKNVADELCRSLRDFMQRISENCCSVVIEDRDVDVDDEFDSARLMAEFEAEIYAKLGVEEESRSVDAEADEETAEPAEEKKDDSVSSILSFVSAFSSDEGQKTETEDDKEKDSTVTDILGSLSFLK